MMKAIGIFLVALAFVATTEAATNHILCYWGSWQSRLLAQNIPANQCTQIIFAFLEPVAGGSLGWFNGDTMRALVALKQKNRNLKVTAAIGGWNAGTAGFSAIAANGGQRAAFVQAIANVVSTYQLDGIDIDWEYPTAADKGNFVQLLKDLRTKLGPSKVITAAVGAGSSLIGSSYDVAAMSAQLTFINLMSYDYHNGYEGKTGQHAGLYTSGADAGKMLSADASVQGWIRAGAPPSKLVLGVAFYGRTFTLTDSRNNGLGAPTTGPGTRGDSTQENGLLSYTEICRLQQQGGFWTRRDNQQQAMISSRGNLWIGYDNVDTITAKANYAVQKGLGGVMMWEVDYDDVNGVCNGGRMPLLSAINRVIKH